MKKEIKKPNLKTIVVDADLHREMKMFVAEHQITINELVKNAFSKYKEILIKK